MIGPYETTRCPYCGEALEDCDCVWIDTPDGCGEADCDGSCMEPYGRQITTVTVTGGVL